MRRKSGSVLVHVGHVGSNVSNVAGVFSRFVFLFLGGGWSLSVVEVET